MSGGILRKIKIISLSVLFGLIVSTVFLSGFALLVSRVSMPHSLFSLFSTLSLGIGAFAAGFFGGAVVKSKGLIIGTMVGAAFYLLIFAVSFMVIGEIGLVAVFKLVIVLITAILGAIIGVNKR